MNLIFDIERAAVPTAAVMDDAQEQALSAEFDKQLGVRKSNRFELGRIARELKQLYKEHGKARAGHGWRAFVASRGLNLATVDRWILDFERREGIKPALVKRTTPKLDDQLSTAPVGDLAPGAPFLVTSEPLAKESDPMQALLEALALVSERSKEIEPNILKRTLARWLAELEQDRGVTFCVDQQLHAA